MPHDEEFVRAAAKTNSHKEYKCNEGRNDFLEGEFDGGEYSLKNTKCWS